MREAAAFFLYITSKAKEAIHIALAIASIYTFHKQFVCVHIFLSHLPMPSCFFQYLFIAELLAEDRHVPLSEFF